MKLGNLNIETGPKSASNRRLLGRVVDLAFHVLDALDDDPFQALVTFPLLKSVLFILSWIRTRNDTESYWRRERFACRGRYTLQKTRVKQGGGGG